MRPKCPKSFGATLSTHELVAMKSLGVTPEYAAAMKQKGFGDINVHELISLKAQGMTPEYAGWLKQQFPQATHRGVTSRRGLPSR